MPPGRSRSRNSLPRSHEQEAILAAADDIGAAIVIGGAGRTDLPLIPLGSVSHKLLHLAQLPVMVVPHKRAAAALTPPAGQRAGEPVTG
jgi:nucleotide-binding universal stress UspA family protein